MCRYELDFIFVWLLPPQPRPQRPPPLKHQLPLLQNKIWFRVTCAGVGAFGLFSRRSEFDSRDTRQLQSHLLFYFVGFSFIGLFYFGGCCPPTSCGHCLCFLLSGQNRLTQFVVRRDEKDLRHLSFLSSLDFQNKGQISSYCG